MSYEGFIFVTYVDQELCGTSAYADTDLAFSSLLAVEFPCYPEKNLTLVRQYIISGEIRHGTETVITFFIQVDEESFKHKCHADPGVLMEVRAYVNEREEVKLPLTDASLSPSVIKHFQRCILDVTKLVVIIDIIPQ